MTVERWQAFSLYEQWGHIGSEIGRARHRWEVGDNEAATNALKRALDMTELVALTNHKHSLREVRIFQQILNGVLANPQDPNLSLDSLEHYCMPFALAARKNV